MHLVDGVYLFMHIFLVQYFVCAVMPVFDGTVLRYIRSRGWPCSGVELTTSGL